MFALIDCNNFYASCERLFRPDLRLRPIVVLSGNDGCVIARSNEAKALGIAMGVPFFKVKALCQQHKVSVFSSNFTLYGDLSQRVMATIEAAWPYVEIYSIDEAFLDLKTMPEEERVTFCEQLQKKIAKETGIPTSIGLGTTKTLAKLANSLCKKVLKVPVFDLTSQSEYWLERMPVAEVWGVGRQWSKKLSSENIITAYDLAKVNPHVLRKRFNVLLMQTAMELQGIACTGLEEAALKQSILSSKSFGQMQTQLELIAQAVSAHCTRCVEKLRKQHLVVKKLVVFVQTNRHRDDLAQHNQALEIQFINPTDDVRVITKQAKKGLQHLFREGYFYKKVGVCLEELTLKNPRQIDLFYPTSDIELEKTEQFMRIIESINQRFGSQTIRLAAQGYSQPWARHQLLKSPAYTTRWDELPSVVV